MFVHVRGSLGHSKILTLSSNCDVIVLGVRAFALSTSLEELWVGYSSGKKFSYIAIHDVVSCMYRNIALALPGFHAFTGSDTTSSFIGKGKKTAYTTWAGKSIYTNAFLELSQCNPGKEVVDRVFRILQQFVCELYGEVADDVNAVRLDMLVHKGKDFENMPPTSDALYLHTLRCTHISGNIWSFINQPMYVEKEPTDWGYKRLGVKGVPVPIYTTKPVNSRKLTDLDMCGCESGRCKGNCKCTKVPQPCTLLCKCKGKCK